MQSVERYLDGGGIPDHKGEGAGQGRLGKGQEGPTVPQRYALTQIATDRGKPGQRKMAG